MFNNFTIEKEYQCCNVIVEPSQNRGSLLIGDFNSATDPQIHTKHNITTVITAAAGLQHLQVPSTVTHIVYPLKDAKTQNIRHYFEQCNKTITERLKEGGVLVHCAAGVSRSATLVIAYIMKKNQLTFKSAIQLVKKYRTGICPNLGFELQLKQYEKQVLGGPSLAIRKNVSQKLSESYEFSEEITPFNSASNRSKKIENYSLFNFEPVSNYKSVAPKKVDPKKTSSKAFGHSKPKEKMMVNVSQTELFVSGKAAKRPSSQVKEGEASKKGMKHAMMETWGISAHKTKQF